MKVHVLFAIIGFFSNSVWADQYQSQGEINYFDSRLDKRKCSGQISDMNCYADIIQESAHRQNVREGYVEPTPQETFELGPVKTGIPNKKKTFYGQSILIDTNDARSCEEVQEFILRTGARRADRKFTLDIRDMCQPSADRFRTITIIGETSEEYLTPIKLDFLKRTDKSLGVDTRNLTLGLVATVGVLWAAPESVSKWDKDEISSSGLLNKWKQNVRSGPVIDKDDPVINYVGHPLSGAAYYTLARSNGASRWESFGYSVLISTFFWEYGFEAFAETPSIQDLILTPVLGSILGEIFYKWSQSIEANDGKALGSKKLGSTLLFIFNPARSLSNQINKLVGTKIIQGVESNFVVGRKSVPGLNGVKTNYIGLEMKFKF